MKFKNLIQEKTKLKDWGIPFGLFGMALAVRIPWLWEIPRYIDELREVKLGYLIYLGKTFPLHNVPKEVGALHNYILAGIFTLLGPSAYWPRLYVAITSALTVVLVFFLGKKLYSSATGVIAAGILLFNGMHILVTHMAWSNCTTPFFFVLALFCTILAGEKKRVKWLMLAGFLWALALQTHSSVIVFLLVAFIYVLSPGFRKNTGFRTADYLKALGAFILGYANMIIYNLTSGFESIRWISAKQYTLETHPGIISFANNAWQMLIELIRSISSTYSNYNYSWGYLNHPAFVLSLLLFGVGIYLALVRGSKNEGLLSQPKLLVWMIAGGFLVIPWINHRYGFFIVTRYIMPVIVCSVLLVAAAVNQLWEMLYSKLGASINSPVLTKVSIVKLLNSTTKAILIVILAAQLVPFYQYCRELNHTDLSNHLSLEVLDRIKSAAGGREMVVLIDQNLTVKDAPLPTLFKMSKINYITLPKDIISQPSSNFQSIFKNNPLATDAKLVAVLSTPVYNQLRSWLPVANEKHFSQQLLLNTDPEVFKREVIHITEMGNLRNLYSANLKSHKS